ncbi:hypothetical protein [Dyella nitratireducens]|uniref:Lipoprotein n=1 Tax=Dyella nitratireducens TaxID=1849580 RepID=A0ABQ1GKA5_9GAMM|nr:hypothetical protein [Dyella nitratireducens]GGA45286.1 hypothetical protein GCM10010981_37970 [Dyella nitratireducens]GLQ41299.1 hypothetical protein GCM10007902_11490 [Dyella nitratireducens]
MKRFLVIATAAALLSACGGQNVHEAAAIGDLVKPGTAPWLTVTGGADKLDVRGLDHKLTLEPSPNLATAVQSQLGGQLAASYVQDLVVTCSGLTTSLRVDEDKSPGNVAMELGVHCSLWAHGFEAEHDYKTQPSASVAGGGGDQAYAQALPKLLADGAEDIAAQMRGDIRKIGRR